VRARTITKANTPVTAVLCECHIEEVMTANDRNRYAFSYNSLDVRNKNFIFKNFPQ
jgi:hypothetical protein